MNQAIIKISGAVMDKPFNDILRNIKEKGLDYEIIDKRILEQNLLNEILEQISDLPEVMTRLKEIINDIE